MVTYEAPFTHWSDFSFTNLADFTFEYMAEPSHALELSADIILAPVTDNSARCHYIITPELVAYSKEFARVLDMMFKMRLFRRIEYCTGEDLDNIWGRIYERRRLYGESDDDYRKRLQIFLLQIAGSGTKGSVEEIISIICGVPNSCRIDTYWPGLCRIYITKDSARINARARRDLINLILPDTLAAGIDYRFYIPYYDLAADINIQGPTYNYLAADIALRDKARTELEADLILGSRHYEELEASIYLTSTAKAFLSASIAMQDEFQAEAKADIALSGRDDTPLEAGIGLMGQETTTFEAYLRLTEDYQAPLDADICLQGRRLRPCEARIILELTT
jgi:hypothetical protein